MEWEDFVEEVAKFEGCPNMNGICKPYKDSGGTLTIGYGFTDPKYTSRTDMSVMEAKAILSNLLSERYLKVETKLKYWGYEFNTQMKQALTSFVFNLGYGNLNKLTNEGKRNPREIANAILLYNKCGNTVLQGLVRRRQWEQTVFLSGMVDYGVEVESIEKKIQKECNRIIMEENLEAKTLTVDGIIGNKSLNTIYDILQRKE